MNDKMDILELILCWMMKELEKDTIEEELALTYRDCIFKAVDFCSGVRHENI